MRILILGSDGYLGWPTAMFLAAKGHEVCGVDNYLRRQIALETDSEPLFPAPNLTERARLFAKKTGKTIRAEIFDLRDRARLARLVEAFRPDALVHYAEQPSAPYSMMGASQASLTLGNNLETTFNVIWAAIEHAPACHIVKLGTMGEYGTPDIDIEEGWLDVEHKGRKQRFLYPRAAGSLYHTAKVLDTDLLWFYVRTCGLRVTDLMQGPVYGLSTPETDIGPASCAFSISSRIHFPSTSLRSALRARASLLGSMSRREGSPIRVRRPKTMITTRCIRVSRRSA